MLASPRQRQRRKSHRNGVPIIFSRRSRYKQKATRRRSNQALTPFNFEILGGNELGPDGTPSAVPESGIDATEL
uniref:Uncharacterized protein n=1 Tax=Trichogramma kaykai TaxID=54128 RepID=A0ABD2W4V8_9HYME